MSNPKQYVPKASAKEVTTQYGPLLKLSFKAAELIAFIQANTNSKGYINFAVSKRKEPGQYGQTHSISLDTWEPTGAKQNEPAQPATAAPDNADDVPF